MYGEKMHDDSFIFILSFGPTADFPITVMELSSEEIKDWYSPLDFGIGKTVNVMGKRFLM